MDEYQNLLLCLIIISDALEMSSLFLNKHNLYFQVTFRLTVHFVRKKIVLINNFHFNPFITKMNFTLFVFSIILSLTEEIVKNNNNAKIFQISYKYKSYFYEMQEMHNHIWNVWMLPKEPIKIWIYVSSGRLCFWFKAKKIDICMFNLCT